jgi:hypothetical protein
MISSGVNQVAAAIGTAPTSKSTDTQLSQVWKCHGAPRPFRKLLFFRYFCGKDVQTWKVFRFPYACSYCLRHWDFTGTANDIHQSMRVSTVRRMFAGSWKSHVSLVSTSVLSFKKKPLFLKLISFVWNSSAPRSLSLCCYRTSYRTELFPVKFFQRSDTVDLSVYNESNAFTISCPDCALTHCASYCSFSGFHLK